MKTASIIVPVYNTEKEIQQTISSLVNQTYPNIEIIIIDDGSTDNSSQVIQSLMKEHHNIKYYYQNNQGVSAARNNGIEKASGDFIMFVDSDDYVSPHYVAKMIEAIGDNDIVVCGVNTPGKNSNSFPMVKEQKVVSQLEHIKDILMMNNCSYVIWNKLYKKELFKKHNIKFIENYRYEDMIFAYETALNINKICYIPDKLYYYCSRPNSYIASIPQTRGDQYIEAILKVKQLLEEHQIIPLVSDEYYHFMLVNHYFLSQLFVGQKNGLTIENYSRSACILLDLVREARNITNTK